MGNFEKRRPEQRNGRQNYSTSVTDTFFLLDFSIFSAAKNKFLRAWA